VQSRKIIDRLCIYGIGTNALNLFGTTQHVEAAVLQRRPPCARGDFGTMEDIQSRAGSCMELGRGASLLLQIVTVTVCMEKFVASPENCCKGFEPLFRCNSKIMFSCQLVTQRMTMMTVFVTDFQWT
jgi:hypothetical protein